MQDHKLLSSLRTRIVGAKQSVATLTGIRKEHAAKILKEREFALSAAQEIIRKYKRAIEIERSRHEKIVGELTSRFVGNVQNNFQKAK